MVKKLKKMAEHQAASSSGIPAGLFDSRIAQNIKDSAQQIWLAGLGAFSKAQGEGGKVFDTLIKEGVNLQRKTRSAAEEKFGEVSSKMSGMAEEVTTKAGQHWDKLESIFEDRVAKSLKRLGVPSAKDVDSLIARIDTLAVAVTKLSGKPTAKKAAPAKSAAPKPVAVKRAPAKKGAAPAQKAAAKRVVRKSAA